LSSFLVSAAGIKHVFNLMSRGVFWSLTNERDFPVPSETRPVRVAVYGN
jgi:hypothetical protein